ncbi:MAG TPA: secretion protein HlyD [Planctomycetales bacterium]|jgi:HlyD family secretion protein|nr:secretion protein HlyD [Planctomycetales bacterium]
MTDFRAKYRPRPRRLGGALVALCALAGCGPSESNRVQGYVEGEYVYVASPLAGAVETLDVKRGAEVKVGDPLFALDGMPEKAARDEAARKVAQARADWEDLKKGKRPSEIESVKAQLGQARAALTVSEKELARQQKLAGSNATAEQDLEQARSTRDQNWERAAQLQADLTTAQLPARPDQVAAAEANVYATEAALAQAEWNLTQKRQAAPQAGVVIDILYWQGEVVAANRPVVVLLPPENIKVRAFVSQTRLGGIRVGQTVRVSADGAPAPYVGHVTFISPQAEYTPPVIYSRESRAKLVFMIEARFDPATAAKMHPGQPVDVEFGD